jgi:rod shape determining protein RodA
MHLFSRFIEGIRQYDWILTSAVVLLMAIGLSAVYSIDLSRGGDVVLTPRQGLSMILGFACMWIFGGIHRTTYRRTAPYIFIFSFLLLAAVLIFGSTIRGTTGWFRLGGFSFQPVEFAKIALILFTAYLIERHARRFERLEFFLGTLLSTGLVMGLVLLQPDTGSALVLAGIWFGMFALTRTRRRYIFGIIGVGAIAAVLAWFFLLAPYQKDRILTFVHGGNLEADASYNLEQSIIAIGSGQVTGRGLGFGSQSQLHFLPEAQTDFIFAAIGEELGFLGAVILLGLFCVIIGRLLWLSTRASDDFEAYTLIGIAVLFGLHLAINVLGVLRLLPLTGIPLPFVSYGGSSLIMSCVVIGVAQSMARSRKRS